MLGALLTVVLASFRLAACLLPVGAAAIGLPGRLLIGTPRPIRLLGGCFITAAFLRESIVEGGFVRDSVMGITEWLDALDPLVCRDCFDGLLEGLVEM